MPEWLGIVLPFALFAVFFVMLRRSADRPKVDIPRQRLRLAQLLIPAFTLTVILVGLAADLSPAIAFALIVVGVLFILRLIRRPA